MRRGLVVGDLVIGVETESRKLERALLAADPWCWGDATGDGIVLTEGERGGEPGWVGDELRFDGAGAVRVDPVGGRIEVPAARAWWTLLAVVAELLPQGALVLLRGTLRAGHVLLGGDGLVLVGDGDEGWWAASTPPEASTLRTRVRLSGLWTVGPVPEGLAAEPLSPSALFRHLAGAVVRGCTGGPFQQARFDLLARLSASVPAATVAHDEPDAGRLDDLSRALVARRFLAKPSAPAVGAWAVTSSLLAPR